MQLEQTPSHPKHSSHESTKDLLEATDADNNRYLLHSAERKPFFLHPSMWMWEVVSIVFSVLIFIAIVTVLVIYNGKPSPVIGAVTLNAAIAFAATFFRMSLMVPVTSCMCQLTWVSLQKGYKPLRDIVKFDTANRGPLGSLQLLLELRHLQDTTNPSRVHMLLSRVPVLVLFLSDRHKVWLKL